MAVYEDRHPVRPFPVKSFTTTVLEFANHLNGLTSPHDLSRIFRPRCTDAEACRDQFRRQMARPMAARMKYGFCRVHRRVLDTPGVRFFESTWARLASQITR